MYTWKKKALSIIGVLVLGALGNGLWELAKPALTGTADIALNISTLGIQTFRDSFYAAASRHGSAAAHLSAQASLTRLLIAIAAYFLLISLDTLTLTSTRVPAEKALARRFLRITSYPLLLFSTMFAITALRDVEVRDAARAFEVRLKVLAPVISASDYSRHLARFAVVRTEADYDAALRDLNAALQRAGLEQPAQ